MSINNLQGEILGVRGGLQIWRDLQSLLVKAEPHEIAVLLKMFYAAYEEGSDEGRIAAKNRMRRGL
jgi:hypothetical protein